MDGKKIVRQLLTGSAEIDRLKREVESVVRMVLGFVDHNTLKEMRFKEEIFNSYRYTWRIFVWNSTGIPWDANLKLDAECSSLINGDHMELVYQSMHGYGLISLRDIQAVHEGLPIFIEGMAKTFPGLMKRWQPLLDAAVATHKTTTKTP